MLRSSKLLSLAIFLSLLAACGSPSRREPVVPGTIPQASRPAVPQGNEVVLYALGLIDTGYRFGGKNPEAGLDCSGMVSYIYEQALGLAIKGSPADIARRGKSVSRSDLLQPVAEAKGWNLNNAHIELYHWRKFNGISGRATVTN